MPELSRFYGIVIRMYYRDHNPPHFHAEYGGWSAMVDISTFAVIDGQLPARAMGLVVEWASLHRAELEERWEAARTHRPLGGIEPLA